MVVFEVGFIRYAGLVMFSALAVAWFLARKPVRLRTA
jgi:hypothetical protein